MAKVIVFDLPVKIGNTTIWLPAIASYTLDQGYRPTEIDPGEPGIELNRITVNVNDETIDIDWTDEPWVDDLCSEIYEDNNG